MVRKPDQFLLYATNHGKKTYQNQLRSRQNDVEIRNVKTLSLILFKSNFMKIFI